MSVASNLSACCGVIDGKTGNEAGKTGNEASMSISCGDCML